MRVIKRVKWPKKMVESMFERTNDYSRHFQKKIRYFICNSEPQFDSNPTKNFAYSQHKRSLQNKAIPLSCHCCC